MAQPEEPLAAVEELWRKSLELSRHSNDGLLAVMTKGQETMTVVLSNDSDRRRIQRALRSLDSERLLSMEDEDANPDINRIIAYDLINSLHVTLVQLTKKIEELQNYKDRNLPKATLEQFMQTDEIPFPNFMEDGVSIKEEDMQMGDMISNYNPLFHEKEEEIDDFQQIPAENEMSALDGMRDGIPFEEDDMLNGDMPRMDDTSQLDMRSLIDQSVDNTDDHQVVRMDDTLHMDSLNEQPLENADETTQYEPLAEDFDNDGNDMTVEDPIEEEGEKEEAVDDTVQKTQNILETVEVDNKRRSSRNVPKPQNYADSWEESDGDVEPAEKKMRSDAMKKGGMKAHANNKVAVQTRSSKKKRVSKINGTVLDCPECEYHSRSVKAWMDHLRAYHRTTPALAGLALLCQCGDESLSDDHSRVCSISNITVIRKSNGPIRRIEDAKTTPQCVLCDIYPKTAVGYLRHLAIHHKSTLISNEIFLKCSCGQEFRCEKSNPDHRQKCNGREFTLHKLDEN